MSDNQRVTEKGSSSITRSSRYWSITINNPTDDDIKQYQTLATKHWVEDVIGQIEQGEQGTRHIQAMLTTKKVRFSQVKRALPRAHIEPAHSPIALAKYVQKEATRIERLPNQHNTTKIATQSDLQRMLYSLCLTMIQTQYFKPTFHRFMGIDWYLWWETRKDQLNEFDAKGLLLTLLETSATYNLMLQEEATKLLQIATEALIEQGYYGIEFVMSNNINKNGFKNHLRSILLRYASQDTQTTSDEETVGV